MVRHNRKRIFVLDHHQKEKPRSSSASLAFGKTTCYDLIIPVRHAFNSKLPVNYSSKLDHATC